MEFAGKFTYVSRSKKSNLIGLKNNPKIKFQSIEEQCSKLKQKERAAPRKLVRQNSLDSISDKSLNQAEQLLLSSDQDSPPPKFSKKNLKKSLKRKILDSSSSQEDYAPKINFHAEKQQRKKEFKAHKFDAQQHYQQQIDTNVMSIKFNVLKQLGQMATGDPIICKECGSIFNKHSIKLSHKNQAKNNDDDLEVASQNVPLDEQQEKKVPAKQMLEVKIPDQILDNLKQDQQAWMCQFCNFINIVQIEEEEVPESEGVNYILESAVQAKEAAAGKAENQDISIVFCVDNSGSMCMTKPIKGKHHLKGDRLNQLKKDLLKFGDGSQQFMQAEAKNVTYISRLQCLQGAIESQIESMAVGAPKRKVGLVSFSNQVNVIGDGSQVPKVFAGDRLNDKEFLMKESEKLEASYMGKQIGETYKDLLNQVGQMEENGPTALGPAIISSVQLASKGKAGSKVILCTDGLANVGLGNLDGLQTDEEFKIVQEFYNSIGNYAKNCGVEVSVITIKGEDCKLQYLSSLTELTGGDILRIDPQNLTEQFANILSNPVIATHVNAKLLLHRAFEFRNEPVDLLSNERSKLHRDIGNVTEQTEITFEYTLKNAQDLIKSNFSKEEVDSFDINKMKAIPFQVQINYTSLDGKKCVRVISKVQEVSDEKEKLMEKADVRILSKNIKSKFAQKAIEGDYRMAQAGANMWMKKMKNVEKNSSEEVKDFELMKNEVRGLYNELQKEQICQEQEEVPLYAMKSIQKPSVMRKKKRTDTLALKMQKLKK